MIVGIGCDIVEHKLTRKLGWSSNIHTLQRILGQKELELYSFKKSVRFISGRFAAKEAVLKCLGTGMKDGIALTDILILQTQTGQPVIHTQGEVQRIAQNLGILYWHISITHTESSSIAFVVCES